MIGLKQLWSVLVLLGPQCYSFYKYETVLARTDRTKHRQQYNNIDMIWQYIISFQSLRVFTFIIHFFLTTVLLWTPFDSISTNLLPMYSQHDYVLSRERFTGVIAFGLTLLCIRGIVILSDLQILSLRTLISLIADSLSSFVITWIIIDGLDWKTYIFIVVFCV